ncbi:MAG: M48 family metallopeptidase [Clostridia bacterium]|nr:M48 family metallopeptidase [Clostridia bacterium]
MDYKIIYSARKTVALEVKEDLQILVRAPQRMSKKQIQAFVEQHREWIGRALERMEKKNQFRRQTQSPEQEALLRAQAKEYLPKRTEEWAEIMDLYPTGVKITGAKTRFGSCSGTNSICYSWRLMAYPKDAIDYVIVHELAHIAQKSHSARFYALVAQYLPDWKKRRNLLKTR